MMDRRTFVSSIVFGLYATLPVVFAQPAGKMYRIGLLSSAPMRTDAEFRQSAWTLAMRDLGWAGYIQVVLFTLILAAGYVYIWRKGVLDWGPTLVQRRAAAAARRSSLGSRTAA